MVVGGLWVWVWMLVRLVAVGVFGGGMLGVVER